MTDPNEKKPFLFNLTAFQEHALLTAINVGLEVLEAKNDEKSKLTVQSIYDIGNEHGIIQFFEEHDKTVARLGYHPAFTREDRADSFEAFKNST